MNNEVTQPTINELAAPHVPLLHAYVPGFQPSGSGWVKLNTNECPYPPSPRVGAAIAGEVGRLSLYPNPASVGLRAGLAERYGLELGQVIVGNGSDDVLNLLVRVFGGPGLPVGMTLPSYSLYPVLTAIARGELLEVPFSRDMELPLGAIAESGARVFFLTSPNAPTGVPFSNEQIASILEVFPGLLVVDEAYGNFAESTAIDLLGRYPRLVVTRTFSKSHALAGLRVGYGLGHPDVIGLLDRVRDSYNVNRLSQVGALAALGDTGYYDEVISRIKATREFLRSELEGRGWFVYPSAANFVFGEPVDARGRRGAAVAAGLYEHLLANKILVRYFAGQALTASFLRISIGTEDQTRLLLESIDSWLKHV